MITLTPFERRLRQELIRVATTYTFNPSRPAGITYGDLGVLIDTPGDHAKGPQPHTRPPFRGFNHALGHVSMYEVEHGRPMLSAVVVTADSYTPGEGFTKLAEHLGFEVGEPESFWRAEVDAVLEFWGSLEHDPTRAIDAALEVLYEEIRAVRRKAI